MKRVASGPAVAGRVGEGLDDAVEFDDGTWPTVGKDQGNGVRIGAFPVDEVDVQAIDLGHELRKPVEISLPRGPVVVVKPVVANLLGVGEGHSLVPVMCRALVGTDGFGIRPPRPLQAGRKVVQR